MKFSLQSLSQTVLNLLRGMTNPSSSLTQIDLRLQSRLLSYIIFIVMAFAVATYLLPSVLGLYPATPTEAAITLAAITVWSIAYVLNRRGSVTVAVILFALSFTLAVMCVVITSTEPGVIYLLYYFLLPIMLVSFFLRLRFIVAFVILHIIAMFAVSALTALIPFRDLPVIFISVMGSLVIFSRMHRDWLEATRRNLLIEERKLAEAQATALAVERERSSLMRQFVRDVSHDLRNPLTVIITGLHLLKISKTPEQQAERLARLEAQAVHLSGLLDSLLTVAHLDKAVDGSFDFQSRDLNQLMTVWCQEQKLSAQEKGVDFTWEPEPALPTVMIDETEMRRAVRQLLTNAISYTPAGGRVAVRTKRSGADVLIEVEDTGIGISPERQALIFELFYRVDTARNTETGGLGLGLAICKRIVEAHQGTLFVRSQPNIGSTFTIRLPVQPIDASASQPSPNDTPYGA